MSDLKKVSYFTLNSHTPDLTIEKDSETGTLSLSVSEQSYGQTVVRLSPEQIKGLRMALSLMFTKEG